MEVIDQPAALIVRPQVLPSNSQFQMMRELALRLSNARGFLPDHFFTGTPEERFCKVLAAIEYGRAVGIEPMIALQNITMINGKAGASALLVGALLRKSGYDPESTWFRLDGTICEENDPAVTGCKVVIKRRSDGKLTGNASFSDADARRAKLVRGDSGYEKFPRDMYYARALTAAARRGAQDAALGMAYNVDELAPNVTMNTDGEIEVTQASPETVAALEEVQGSDQRQSGGSDSPPSTAIQESATAVTSEPPPAPTAAAERSARSVGPRPKRQNVVQAPTKPATVADMAKQAPAPDGPGEPALAPPDLTDEGDQEDEGQRVYMRTLRQDLRERAAMLAHVNAILRNTLEHAAKGQVLEPVPPATPSEQSDEGLARLIERDNAGQTLATLGEAALEACLKVVEANLAKKKAIMAERGIKDD